MSVAAQYAPENLDVRIRGFAKRGGDVALVLCGQDYAALRGVIGVYTDLRGLVESLGLMERVRITSYLDDATLGRWYRGAAAFALPSLFRGLGKPAIEALGLGLPTLTTRCAALSETMLGIAAYVDKPTDSGDWAERMGDMLRNPAAYRPDFARFARLRTRYDPVQIASA